MVSDDDLRSPHTDFIAENQPLIAWLFDKRSLGDPTAGASETPVVRALLSGLRELSESPDKRLRDSAFTIWLGDHEGHFCVGVPHRTSPHVLDLMSVQLRSVPGYWGTDYLPREARLGPTFRYEGGRVIEYSEDEFAGTDRLDDGRGYDSGLTFALRTWRPAAQLGRERYGEQPEVTVRG